MKIFKWITVAATSVSALVVTAVLLSPLLVSQDWLEAEGRAVELQHRLADFYLDNQRFPTPAEGLSALLLAPPPEHTAPRYFPAKNVMNPDTLNDSWGRPFLYRSSEQSEAPCSIVSYGADGAPGGRGANEDIELVCFLPR